MCVVKAFSQFKLLQQGRDEGGGNYSGAEKSQQCHNNFFNTQQYISFRKTSSSNMGEPNLILAPETIFPCHAPAHKITFQTCWFLVLISVTKVVETRMRNGK